jgi:hypothetical protein
MAVRAAVPPQVTAAFIFTGVASFFKAGCGGRHNGHCYSMCADDASVEEIKPDF